jgi:hypothetical protein
MNEKSLPMAGMHQVTELLKVKVFQLNECDAVAAFFLEEAKEWYMKETGLDAKEAFYDYKAEEVPLDQLIWEDETMKNKISIHQVVEEYWNGQPFIAVSSE